MKKIIKEKDPLKNFNTVANVLFAAMIMFIIILTAHLAVVINGAVTAANNVYGTASAAVRADILDYYSCRIVDILTVIAVAVIGFEIFRRFRRDKTPFVPYIGKGLRIMAGVMFGGYIIIMCAFHVIVPNIAGAAPPNEFHGYINGTSMVLVSILCMLSCIFDYGCKLQKESDETL